MLNKQEFHAMVKEKARERYLKLPLPVKKGLVFNDYEIAFAEGFESGLEFIQEEFAK